MYAERKKIALEGVKVELSHKRIYSKDCENQAGMLDEIGCRIHLIGDLDEHKRQRLIQVARHCPVHRTLSGAVRVRTIEKFDLQ